MNKTYCFLILILASIAGLVSCGEGSHRQSLPKSDRDSLYTVDNIRRIHQQDLDLALAYIDTAEMKGMYSHDSILWMRVFVYTTHNEFKKCEALEEEIVHSKDFDPSNPWYIARVMNLADTYMRLEEHDKRILTYQYADSLAIAHGYPEMQAHIKFDIGLYYCDRKDFDMGLPMMKKGIDLVEGTLTESNDLLPTLCSLYGNYANKLLSAERYDSSVVVCQQRLDLIHKMEVEMADYIPDGYVDNLRGITYCYIAAAYAEMQKATEARTVLKQALDTAFGQSPNAAEYFGAIYNQLGDYQQALVYYNQRIKHLRARQDTTNLGPKCYEIAEVYKALKDYKGQAEALETAYDCLTSTNARHERQKTNELTAQFQLKEKELMLELSQARESKTRIINIAVSIVSVLLLTVVVLLWFNNLQMRKKNRALAASINAMLEQKRVNDAHLAREVSSHPDLEETIAKSAETAEESNENTAAHYLMQRFIYELTSRQLYCNPDFNREYLLAELHISKVNFRKWFEEETGQQFAPYLLNLRLEHAAELIRDHAEWSIEAIATESGFSSRSTFYSNFTARFGISPAVYRNELQDKSHES